MKIPFTTWKTSRREWCLRCWASKPGRYRQPIFSTLQAGTQSLAQLTTMSQLMLNVPISWIQLSPWNSLLDISGRADIGHRRSILDSSQCYSATTRPAGRCRSNIGTTTQHERQRLERRTSQAPAEVVSRTRELVTKAAPNRPPFG